MHPLKIFYTPLSGAPRKCFKSGPTLANAGPVYDSACQPFSFLGPALLTSFWIHGPQLKNHYFESTYQWWASNDLLATVMARGTSPSVQPVQSGDFSSCSSQHLVVLGKQTNKQKSFLPNFLVNLSLLLLCSVLVVLLLHDLMRFISIAFHRMRFFSL